MVLNVRYSWLLIVNSCLCKFCCWIFIGFFGYEKGLMSWSRYLQQLLPFNSRLNVELAVHCIWCCVCVCVCVWICYSQNLVTTNILWIPHPGSLICRIIMASQWSFSCYFTSLSHCIMSWELIPKLYCIANNYSNNRPVYSYELGILYIYIYNIYMPTFSTIKN